MGSESTESGDHPSSPLVPHQCWVYKSVRAGALAGGLIFLGLTLMLIVTIVGRKLFAWQVPGDVELVEMGAAVAAAPFFAWCHLQRGEVKIDFITQKMSARWTNLLDGLGSLLIGLFGALLAWRTGALAISSFQSGEISAILAWPQWIAKALLVPGFILLALAGFYSALGYLAPSRQVRAGASIQMARETV